MDYIRSWCWPYPFIHHNLLGNRIKLVQLMLRRIGLEHMWKQVSLPISIGFKESIIRYPFLFGCVSVCDSFDSNIQIQKSSCNELTSRHNFWGPCRRSARSGLASGCLENKNSCWKIIRLNIYLNSWFLWFVWDFWVEYFLCRLKLYVWSIIRNLLSDNFGFVDDIFIYFWQNCQADRRANDGCAIGRFCRSMYHLSGGLQVGRMYRVQIGYFACIHLPE